MAYENHCKKSLRFVLSGVESPGGLPLDLIFRSRRHVSRRLFLANVNGVVVVRSDFRKLRQRDDASRRPDVNHAHALAAYIALMRAS